MKPFNSRYFHGDIWHLFCPYVFLWKLTIIIEIYLNKINIEEKNHFIFLLLNVSFDSSLCWRSEWIWEIRCGLQKFVLFLVSTVWVIGRWLAWALKTWLFSLVHNLIHISLFMTLMYLLTFSCMKGISEQYSKIFYLVYKMKFQKLFP